MGTWGTSSTGGEGCKLQGQPETSVPVLQLQAPQVAASLGDPQQAAAIGASPVPTPALLPCTLSISCSTTPFSWCFLCRSSHNCPSSRSMAST